MKASKSIIMIKYKILQGIIKIWYANYSLEN